MSHFPGYLGFSERIRATSLSFWTQLAVWCRQSVKESEEGKKRENEGEGEIEKR